MGLENKTKILLLVPDVDASIGTTRVADTILIERGTGELGLLELGAEGTVLEELLACISWVPELKGS